MIACKFLQFLSQSNVKYLRYSFTMELWPPRGSVKTSEHTQPGYAINTPVMKTKVY